MVDCINTIDKKLFNEHISISGGVEKRMYDLISDYKNSEFFRLYVEFHKNIWDKTRNDSVFALSKLLKIQGNKNGTVMNTIFWRIIVLIVSIYYGM